MEYLSKKFELTLHDPKKQNNFTVYKLLYKGWCPVGRCVKTRSQFVLIIGYFVAYVNNFLGVISLTTSQGEVIDDSTIWSWIVGSIQQPIRYETFC